MFLLCAVLVICFRHVSGQLIDQLFANLKFQLEAAVSSENGCFVEHQLSENVGQKIVVGSIGSAIYEGPQRVVLPISLAVPTDSSIVAVCRYGNASLIRQNENFRKFLQLSTINSDENFWPDKFRLQLQLLPWSRSEPSALRLLQSEAKKNLERLARNAFDFTNEYRVENGLSQLYWSYALEKMALKHSKYMATKREISHDSEKPGFTKGLFSLFSLSPRMLCFERVRSIYF